MGFKKCNKCEINKPLNEFHKSKKTKDGVVYSCKVCTNLLDRERKSLNSKPKEIIPEGEKRCTKCYEIKKISDFSKQQKGKYGVRSICKKCCSKAKPKEFINDGFKRCN